MSSTRCVRALVMSAGWLYGACAGADPGPASSPASSPAVAVVVQGDRLSGRIEHAPLRGVLAELRRQAGIQSEFIDPADNDTVTQAFEAVPLVEALSLLLNGRSFAIFHDAAPTGEGATQQPRGLRLVILPRAGVVAPATRVAVANAAPDLNDLAQAMVDPDEGVRTRAQEMFEEALKNQHPSTAGTPRLRR